MHHDKVFTIFNTMRQPKNAQSNMLLGGGWWSKGATKQFGWSERVKNINLLFARSVNDLTEIKLYETTYLNKFGEGRGFEF